MHIVCRNYLRWIETRFHSTAFHGAIERPGMFCWEVQIWCLYFEGKGGQFPLPAVVNFRSDSARSTSQLAINNPILTSLQLESSALGSLSFKVTSTVDILSFRAKFLLALGQTYELVSQSGCGSEWRRSPRPRLSAEMKRWVSRQQAPLSTNINWNTLKH